MLADSVVMDARETAAELATEGWVVVRGVWDDDRVAEASAALVASTVPENGVLALDPERDPLARGVGGDPRLVELARAVLGGAVAAFGVSFMVKPPRSALPVLWHQDGHPWRERWAIEQAVTAWVALDASTVESGCLWVVPGSHHLGARPLVARADPPNVFGWESPPELVDETAAVPVELEPGDVSLHHPALLHRSGPNRTDRRRVALAVRYRSA